jgi:hypothetical protein
VRLLGEQGSVRIDAGEFGEVIKGWKEREPWLLSVSETGGSLEGLMGFEKFVFCPKVIAKPWSSPDSCQFITVCQGASPPPLAASSVLR